MHSISVAICLKNPKIIQRLRAQRKRLYMIYGQCVIIAPFKGIQQFLLKNDIEQVVFAYTDYFGGSGDQSARLLDLHQKTQLRGNINQMLSLLGVRHEPNTYDLFETVGLHKIRTNNDLTLFTHQSH